MEPSMDRNGFHMRHAFVPQATLKLLPVLISPVASSLHLGPGLADLVEVLCGRLCEGQVSVMEEERGIEGRRVGSKRKGGLEEVRL